MRRASLAIICHIAVASSALAQARTVIPLDGTWQIAEGSLEQVPERFDHQVPVPGLADLSEPKFAEVGTPKSPPLRRAFWYRREFKIPGELPPVVRLKVHKAMFGTKVLVNGQLAGEHLPCFTPGEFDIRTFVRADGATNTLVIRVGADRGVLPKSVPDGADFEKFDYPPGIYDSVELITSGSPRIANVQIVPNVAARSVRVVAEIQGASGDGKTLVRIREAVGGRQVAQAEVNYAPLGSRIDVGLPVPECQPWTPESPFLYTAEVTTSGDQYSTRFGMRSFSLDPQTGHALLNGKPYFLRGTNVCIGRFFEDPKRGSLPWREEWVRKLHRVFKQMNWNCARYCIGFPPEMWYRIADEEGILIQDEFPLWYGGNWPAEIKADHLVPEFTEWMRERWNHPCVAIWDACNETVSTETGKAIHAVRSLDLSGRPWDNGWSPADAPGDVYEAHPYVFASRASRLRDFASLSGAPGVNGCMTGNPAPNALNNAIIINEYSWGHLDRTGRPTHPWMVAFYEDFLGADSTADQRREFHSRVMAAESEFWRARRKIAGLIHFCGLAYSKKEAVTSDHFLDIEALTLEQPFRTYVRDAFAPVGVCIDHWQEEALAGTRIDVPVIVTNDLEKPWAGAVRLKLTRAGQALFDQTKPCGASSWGQTTLKYTLDLPSEPGATQLVVELINGHEPGPCSLRDVIVMTAAQVAAREGIARGKPVKASSVFAGAEKYPAEFAVDGIATTRWSSEFSEPQWIAIDLGSPTTISRVELAWEAAYGLAYSIQTSLDGEQWSDVYKTDAGKGGVEKISFAATTTRWVRMYGMKRASPGGFSLWEFRVYP